MKDEWYVYPAAKKDGPFTTDEVKELASEGELDPNDLLQEEGVGSAVAVSAVKGLPVSVAGSGQMEGVEDAEPSTPPRGSVFRDRRVIIAAACAAGLLVATVVVVASRGRSQAPAVVANEKPDDYGNASHGEQRLSVPAGGGQSNADVTGKQTGANSGGGGGNPFVRSDPSKRVPPDESIPRNRPVPDVPVPVFDKSPPNAEFDFTKLDYKKGPSGEKLSPVQGVDVDENLVGPNGPVPNGRWEAQAYQDARGIWKHGVQTHWNLSGKKVREVYWFCGKEHGPTKKWHANGQLGFEGAFKDGKPHGVATLWYENGKKASESFLVDGLQQGYAIQWDESGAKKLETMFKDGKQHGPAATYYPTGGRRRQVTYQTGKLDGNVSEWHPNGMLATQVTMRDGKKVGEEVTWDSDGRLALVIDWDADISKPAPPITRAQYDQIRVGMTRFQVMRILGGKWAKTIRSETFKEENGKFGYRVVNRDIVRYDGKEGYATFTFEGDSTDTPLVKKDQSGLK